MKPRVLLGVAILGVCVCLPGNAKPAGKKPKVGDWAEYKRTNSIWKESTTIKQTVTAVGEFNALVKEEIIGGEKKTPPTEVAVPFEELGHMLRLFVKGKGKSAFEKSDSGEAELEIMGKKVTCQWTLYKHDVTPGGTAFEQTAKIWVCRQFPMGGVVRMELDFIKGKMTQELVNSGQGK